MTGQASRFAQSRPTAEPSEPNGGLTVLLNALRAAVSLAAIATLALLWGFGGRTPWPAQPVTMPWGATLGPIEALRVLACAMACYFVLDEFARLAVARNAGEHLRKNWPNFAMIAMAGIAMAAGIAALAGKARAAEVTLAVGPIYAAFALLGQAVEGAAGLARRYQHHPAQLLVYTFLILCLVGSGLLMLPVCSTASASRMWFVDALFTAASSACLCGLGVRNLGTDFSPAGQAVVLCLVQAGGLAIMIFGTAMAVLLGRTLGLAEEELESPLSRERVEWGQAAGLVIGLTAGLEILGAALLFPMFSQSVGDDGHVLSAGKAVWYSVFHSVSAFCNAGMSLNRDSLITLRESWQVAGVIAPLIVLGGLGMPVLRELGEGLCRLLAMGRGSEGPRRWLSTQTKVVLLASAALIALGAAAMIVTETTAMDKNLVEKTQIHNIGTNETDWASLSERQQLREAIFQSVAARTGGLRTMDLSQLSDGGKVTLCGLMLVGGSPAGAAGGMKTVTIALLLLVLAGNLRGTRGGWRPAAELAQRAGTLAMLYVGLVAIVTLALCVAMRSQGKFLDLFFEACSACGNVGFSTGVTPTLNVTGKSALIAAMILGRVGPLAAGLAMSRRQDDSLNDKAVGTAGRRS